MRSWFSEPVAVEHYARAAASLGLWRSEARIFTELFGPGDRLLDLGCGAGRITLGLAERGFSGVVGVDYSEQMIIEARYLAAERRLDVEFAVGDARSLRMGDGKFDGVIFGFNGLMQIPGRENRRGALREILRVIRRGGTFVFTTHGREFSPEVDFWREEQDRWATGRQDRRLRDFGDRIFENPEGRIFMHVPDRPEILEDLAATGWQWREDHRRTHIANEPAAVREFSDECRFWIVRRPD